jgi:hypothetical protein
MEVVEDDVDEEIPVPRMNTVRDMAWTELQSLASRIGLAGQSADRESIERGFGRLAVGGRVLKCPRPSCGNRWVFQGDTDRYKATCPKCYSSVGIDTNTLAVSDGGTIRVLANDE